MPFSVCVMRADFDAILFDFDGVLGRTVEDNERAWRIAFRECGMELDRDAYFLLEGKKADEIAATLLAQVGGDSALAPRIVQRKTEYYQQNNQFALYDGAEPLIEVLRGYGVKMAVVSGGSAARLHKPPTADLLQQFPVVVTGDDVKRTKPAPDPYLVAAERLAVEPGRCLVIENAPLGIAAAKAAGMACVAITSTLAAQYLSQADQILRNLDEVRELVATLASKRIKRRLPKAAEPAWDS